MREILFRGKRKDNGEWVEGNYIRQTLFYGEETDRHWIMDIGEFDYDHYDSYIVIPETVGQYTGLTDKNGTKIFEGDIVKADEFIPTVSGIYEVIYDEVNHCYALERDIRYHFHYFTFSDLNGFQETSEVIGNIHDYHQPEKGGGQE